MRYTDSPARKTIMLIAGLVGATLGGFAVLYFSTDTPSPPNNEVMKKNIQAESRARRAKVNRKRARAVSHAQRQKAPSIETATFALG